MFKEPDRHWRRDYNGSGANDRMIAELCVMATLLVAGFSVLLLTGDDWLVALTGTVCLVRAPFHFLKAKAGGS